MVTFISFFLAALAILLAVPVAVFLAEVIAGVALPQRECLIPGDNSSLRIAVLVPAHDEGTALLPTIVDILAQLRQSDRLLVVADNCTDNTAAVAKAAGAEVIVRNDPDRKGKGYALAFGVSHLGKDPPDIVVMIDSDCRLTDGAIHRLATACATEHRPVQALYLMVAPNESPVNYRAAEFAWRIRNWARPLGLRALGLPCQLMGTGMAFEWSTLRLADLASESIVEDMKLGLDLALSGYPPVFSPFLGVTSQFPASVEGSRSQRLRWEQGHVGMILSAAPRLLLEAFRRRNLDLLAMALDLAVPPLTLLGLLTMGMLAVAGLSAWLGLSSAAMIVSAITFTGFLSAAVISWLKFGRDILPPSAILPLVSYAIGKFSIYRRLFSRTQWIRTDRGKS
jgi:cellulose synthase/poly-beta-1,6-N-acetylglucosamine synthase-like glycosyltransferase